MEWKTEWNRVKQNETEWNRVKRNGNEGEWMKGWRKDEEKGKMSLREGHIRGKMYVGEKQNKGKSSENFWKKSCGSRWNLDDFEVDEN